MNDILHLLNGEFEIPGLNIQWPWGTLILEGKKSIETRSYALPRHYSNQPMALIETPGLRKNKCGFDHARITGILVFSGSFKYRSKDHWLKDSDKHLIPLKHSNYAYSNKRPRWGWIISKVLSLEMPQDPPKTRGIVFAKSCRVSLGPLLGSMDIRL